MNIAHGVFFALLTSSLTAQATPCPNLDISPDEAQAKADWIVEGVVAETRKTGSFVDCEHSTHYCAHVDNPEVVVLSDATVIRGEVVLGTGGGFEISRKSHCFSGALSAMNSKPELSAIGRRLRFFGNDSKAPPFVQQGYFWLEPVH